jgi:hypothetical protein
MDCGALTPGSIVALTRNLIFVFCVQVALWNSTPQSQFAPADMIIHLSLVLMRRKAVGGAAGKSRIAHKCDLLRACLIYTGGVVLCVFASAALCFVSGDEW